mgnify:CR=1 FL=1
MTVVIKKSIPDGSFLRCESEIICYEGKMASAYSDILVESPVLILQKSAVTSSVQAGEELVYEIDYINNGINYWIEKTINYCIFWLEINFTL